MALCNHGYSETHRIPGAEWYLVTLKVDSVKKKFDLPFLIWRITESILKMEITCQFEIFNLNSNFEFYISN